MKLTYAWIAVNYVLTMHISLWEWKYISCDSVLLSKCTSLDGCLGKIINLETGCWKNCSVSLAVSSRKPSIAATPPPPPNKKNSQNPNILPWNYAAKAIKINKRTILHQCTALSVILILCGTTHSVVYDTFIIFLDWPQQGY